MAGPLRRAVDSAGGMKSANPSGPGFLRGASPGRVLFLCWCGRRGGAPASASASMRGQEGDARVGPPPTPQPHGVPTRHGSRACSCPPHQYISKTKTQAIHGETALSFKNMDESEESVVDAIDASIAALCAAETMTREESLGLGSTPCSNMREVRKKVAEWAARSRVVKPVADLPAEVEGLGGAMSMQSGLAMLAASSQSLSGDNLKHVEEHGAAEALGHGGAAFSVEGVRAMVKVWSRR